MPTSRDRTTPLIAAVALLALAFAPWGERRHAVGAVVGVVRHASEWPAFAAAWSLGPLIVAAIAMLVLAWIGNDRATSIAAALGVALGIRGMASSRGRSGPSWGFGAAIALVAAHRRARPRARAAPARSRAIRRSRRSSSSIAALLLLFIFFPVGKSLLASVLDAKGNFAPGLAAERLFTADIWGVGCLGGGTRCGVAINSALLATIVGVLSTLLGLVLALVVQRGGQRYAGVLRGDVDPADHHAAVRHRAGAGRAVRPHRARHRLARARSAFRARAGSTACPA